MAYVPKHPFNIQSVEDLRRWVEDELRVISLEAAETEETLVELGAAAAAQVTGIVTPYEFGAIGDGVVDDGLALQAALATTKHVDLRNGVFASSLPLVMESFQWMYHGKLIKTFNGDLLDMTAPQCALDHVEIDGNGNTGRGVIIGLFGAGGDLSRQLMRRTIIGNSVGYALEFTVADCGALFHADDCAFGRTVSSAEAVKLPIDVVGAFTGRSFVNCSQGGNKFIDLGGSRSTRIIGGGSTGFVWTVDTKYTHIFDHRFGGGTVKGEATHILGSNLGAALTIQGTQHVVEGNTYQGNALTLDTGATFCTVEVGDSTFTESAGVASNKVYGFAATFAPIWESGGSAPAIGDGTLTGRASREGYRIKTDITLVFGSTTTLGTGDYRFRMPAPWGLRPASGVALGVAYFFDASTNNEYRATVYIDSTSDQMFLSESGGGTGYWGAARPVVPATGDIIHLDLDFQVGA